MLPLLRVYVNGAEMLRNERGAVLVEDIFILTSLAIICIVGTHFVVARLTTQLSLQQSGYTAAALTPLAPALPTVGGPDDVNGCQAPFSCP